MKYRKAVFVVVYFEEKEKIKFLILKRKLHWKGWEFPKGGVEAKEKLIDAVKREIKEETGLKILRIKKFNEKGKYKYQKKFSERKGILGQTYFLFSVEVEKAKVKIDKKEHSSFKWFDFEKAEEILTWENQKKCLKIVNNWLEDGKI